MVSLVFRMLAVGQASHLFIYFFFGGGVHFANTLFQKYYTAKKLTNQERDCGIQAAKLATLTFITIPLIG